jgi:hypothetical protein
MIPPRAAASGGWSPLRTVAGCGRSNVVSSEIPRSLKALSSDVAIAPEILAAILGSLERPTTMRNLLSGIGRRSALRPKNTEGDSFSPSCRITGPYTAWEWKIALATGPSCLGVILAFGDSTRIVQASSRGGKMRVTPSAAMTPAKVSTRTRLA